MSSESVFGFTEEEVVYELATSLHSRTLGIMVYGIYTAVYFVALYLTLSRAERRRVGSAILITVMWVLVTVHASIIWVYVDKVFIRHGETRTSQIISALSPSAEFFPFNVTNAIVTFASVLLADMTMIWRCWALYDRRWLITLLPGITLVAATVCYIWRTIITLTSEIILIPALITKLELTYISTTVFTNIFCTTAIIYRIVSVSGWRKSLKTYRSLIEIIIESAVMYTVIYVVRIGMQIYAQYFADELDERLHYVKALAVAITGIAPTLIIARVAAGFARPDDSWSHTSLPHMRSTMRSLAESLHFAQPATATITDNVDLERSIGSEASAAMDEGDEMRRESPKSTTGGGKAELGEVSKEV